jgi:mono/diheme cytochrome c family protein
MKRYVLLYRFAIACATTLLIGCSGRDDEEPVFRINTVAIRRYELDLDERFTDRQRTDIQESLARLFGTPDKPCLPDDETLQSVVDLELVRLAAGPVVGESSDTTNTANGAGQGGGTKDVPGGLYRQHCAHCHGITGDGDGPAAAWMNPYPRDFRHAVFQYKSTPLGRRPTDDDLRRIVTQGAPGTAMPAFNHLDDREIDALVAYVKYLAIRGQTELTLIDFSSELDAAGGERLDTSDEFLVEEIVAALAGMWATADEFAIGAPGRPDIDFETSARRGRDIFFSETGGCMKCHGPTGLGDGLDEYYDYWSEQLEPAREKRVGQYLALGALPPRKIVPHNLRSGVYRGGRRAIDLYNRVRNGIDGTPMPAASMKTAGTSDDAVGLTSDDIWHLVDYVRSLPYESITHVSTTAGRADQRDSEASADPVLARVTVRQFDWQVQYPGGDKLLDTLDDLYAVNQLRLPQGEPCNIAVTSGDVRHRIRFPEWGIRQTVVPGKTDWLKINYDKEGVFRLVRDGRVGWGHPPVEARVVVQPRREWEKELEKIRLSQSSPGTPER